jgi:hypothetical protein
MEDLGLHLEQEIGVEIVIFGAAMSSPAKRRIAASSSHRVNISTWTMASSAR